MPVPLDERGEAGPAVVAWLRCLELNDGSGFRAALLQTTGDGTPVSFCFARSERGTESGAGFRARCIRSVLRSARPSLELVIGFAEELPPTLLLDDLRSGVPVCRVRRLEVAAAVGSSASDRERIHEDWLRESPEPQSAGRVLLDQLMTKFDPLEPLRRAASGLREAFIGLEIDRLTGIPEVAVVVDLSYTDSDVAVHYQKPPSVRPLPERLRRVLAAPPESMSSSWPTQLEWVSELLPFQRIGVRMLIANERLLLADDMGLGKTVQAVAALRILRANRSIRNCLIVAPATLLNQWRGEIHKWAPELQAIIVRGRFEERVWQWASESPLKIVSYETLRSDSDVRDGGPLSRCRWDVVIADEAQKIKNRNRTSEVLKRLDRARSWALTGTPLENDEDELASIMEFVDHDPSGGRRRYRPGLELRARHAMLQLRRKKLEVLDDLPPKLTTTLELGLSHGQRRTYERLEREGIVHLKSLGSEIRVHHVLALITRLKQICNVDPETGESSKLDDIEGRLTELVAERHKALVFSQYVDEPFGVAAVAKRFERFKPLVITGAVPSDERAEVIRRFRSETDHRVLVLSLRVGGLGLNLQEASYVFHLDRWWNPATEAQADDRTYRFGQSFKVNVFKYTCLGTIEARIEEVLRRKRELFADVVDDVSLDVSSRFTQAELLELFGLGSGNE